MKRYSVRRVGSLLITKAALSGPAGTKVLNLLVDTGSTYSIAAVEAVEAIGCSLERRVSDLPKLSTTLHRRNGVQH